MDVLPGRKVSESRELSIRTSEYKSLTTAENLHDAMRWHKVSPPPRKRKHKSGRRVSLMQMERLDQIIKAASKESTGSGRLAKDIIESIPSEQSDPRASLYRNEPLKQRLTMSADQDLPKEAVRRLLAHVHMDPDGGLLNINIDANGTGTQNQVSKIPALRKDLFEVGLALLVPISCAVNVMGIFSPVHSDFYGFGDNSSTVFFGTSAYEKEIRKLAHPIEAKISCMYQLIVAVHVFEFTFMVGLLGRLMWNTFGALVASRESDSVMKQRYFRISDVFLNDIPYIQSFSIMQTLGYCHPNLVRRHLGSLNTHETAARVLLEKFLRLKENEVGDHELVEKAAMVLMANEHTNEPEDVRRNLALEYIYETPYGILEALLGSANIDWETLQANNDNLDVSAMSAWRFRVLVFYEMAVFAICVIVMLLVGVLGIFVKVCQLSIIFTGEQFGFWPMTRSFVVFVNQMLGFLQVRVLLISRVETFVFGGTDAVLSDDEQYLMHVYYATLVEEVLKTPSLSIIQKIAVFLQFDDDDLQQLIIDEEYEEKSDIMLAVRKYRQKRATPLIAWVRDGYCKIFDCCR